MANVVIAMYRLRPIQLRITNFQCYMTLILTLDRVIWHTIVYHSSTSTYIPNFIRIGETFCGQMYVCTNGRTALLGRLGGIDLKKGPSHSSRFSCRKGTIVLLDIYPSPLPGKCIKPKMQCSILK